MFCDPKTQPVCKLHVLVHCLAGRCKSQAIPQVCESHRFRRFYVTATVKTLTVYHQWTRWSSPLKQGSLQARREPQRGPGKHSRGTPIHFHGAPLDRNFLKFFFTKWYILAYFIFLADSRAPKRRGTRGSLPPLPHPFDGSEGNYSATVSIGCDKQVCTHSTSRRHQYIATSKQSQAER